MRTRLNVNTVFPCIAIPIINMRRPWDRLILETPYIFAPCYIIPSCITGRWEIGYGGKLISASPTHHFNNCVFRRAQSIGILRKYIDGRLTKTSSMPILLLTFVARPSISSDINYATQQWPCLHSFIWLKFYGTLVYISDTLFKHVTNWNMFVGKLSFLNKSSLRNIPRNINEIDWETLLLTKIPRPLFTKKTRSYGYRDPHDKPKMVWRPSHVYNRNPCADW